MNNKETLNAYNGRLSTNNDTIININSLLKRLPVGGEDLTEELTNYDASLTAQETSIQDIIEALEGKSAGGGGSKYAPKHISFWGDTRTNLDDELAQLDFSQLTDANGMFYFCTALTSLDLSNFDTSKVTNMQYMFRSCYGLTELDLSGFDTSNVTNMAGMFMSTGENLKKIDMRNFTLDNVTNYTNMFENTHRNCLIIVKDSTVKSKLIHTFGFTFLINVKTVAELEG